MGTCNSKPASTVTPGDASADHDERSASGMDIHEELTAPEQVVEHSPQMTFRSALFAVKSTCAFLTALSAVRCDMTPEEKITLDPNEPQRVVFIGCTGTGKSSLCTALTGQDVKGATEFKIGSRGKSETVNCKDLRCHWLGDKDQKEFVCIDTPGLNDSEGRDDALINDIITNMQKWEYVNALVLVAESGNPRFSRSLQDVIQKFEEAFCGPKAHEHGHDDPEYDKRCAFFYENILVVFQKWKMNDDAVLDREEFDITEDSVAADFNLQLRAKFPNCRRDVPCVFVDSHDRNKPRRSDALLQIAGKIPPDVFRTQNIQNIVPRIRGYDGSEQTVVSGTRIGVMKPDMVDSQVDITSWGLHPDLPDGLQFNSRNGKIWGTPRKWMRPTQFSITAQGAGGHKSEAFSLALVIELSEEEMVEAIASARTSIEPHLRSIARLAKPQSEADLDQVTLELSAKAEACLADVQPDLDKQFANMKQLSKLSERVAADTRSVISDCVRDLQALHSRYVSEQAKLNAALEAADNEVQQMVLVFSTDHGKLAQKIAALDKLDIPPGHKSIQTLENAKEWLKKIELVNCPNGNCPHKCMFKDIGAHEAMCMYCMPLRHRSQISKERAASCDEKLEITSDAHDSWNGVYTRGRCRYIDDDTGKGWFKENRRKQRIQRILPADGRGAVKWTIQSWNRDTETVFTSSNEVENVADAQFEGITIQPAETFAFSDTAAPQLSVKAPKLIYFGGQWCPYCPPFTAKLKIFYEVLRENQSPIEVIFVSSDRDDDDFFDYFGGHHGDWFALDYSARSTKSALSKLFKVDGIPSCAVIGNDSKPIDHFANEFDVCSAIRGLTGDKKQDFNKIVEIYQELVNHYKTDAEIEQERRHKQEKEEAEKKEYQELTKQMAHMRQDLSQKIETVIGKVDDVSHKLDGLYTKFDDEVKKVIDAVYEATEVEVPSSFVILPNKISESEPDTSLIALSEDGSGFELTDKGKSMVDDAGALQEKCNRALGWLSQLSNIGDSLKPESLAENAGAAVASAVEGFFAKATEQKNLYLYLVDELTGKPVIPDDDDEVYPIEIAVVDPGATKRYLPVMRMSLKATSLINGGAELGRMFGFPCPKLPEALIGKVKDAVGVYDCGCSIAAEFDALNASVEGAVSGEQKDQKQIRGDLLREFQQLLEEHDKTKDYCGLKRQHTKAGHAVWTIEQAA